MVTVRTIQLPKGKDLDGHPVSGASKKTVKSRKQFGIQQPDWMAMTLIGERRNWNVVPSLLPSGPDPTLVLP
jgi:hypothetical protein